MKTKSIFENSDYYFTKFLVLNQLKSPKSVDVYESYIKKILLKKNERKYLFNYNKHF